MKKKIILVQPKLAFVGTLICHIPLSLLYVASKVVKNGYEVVIIDNRLYPDNWQDKLREAINDNTLLVGVTAWTGQPLVNAVETSKLVKEINPKIPVVWGGPHPTVIVEQTIEKDYIDFLVRGCSGSEALLCLAEALNGNMNLSEVPGLTYKQADKFINNEVMEALDIIAYEDIPYHLIEDFSMYGQLDYEARVFPIFAAYGCPYKCTFCLSPVLYRNIKKKWCPQPAEKVVDHIEFLIKNYGADYIYFYDEDSFVNLNLMKSIAEEIDRRKIKIKLGFRGVRANEIVKMDEDYLQMLAKLGNTTMHIGLESGSQRILDMFKKGTTPEMILEANRKLAGCPNIIAGFNVILGTPGETIEDLKKTKNLILQVLEENPNAIIFLPNKFKPYPGAELEEIGRKMGLKRPETLEGWFEFDNETDIDFPWFTPEIHAYVNMLQVVCYAIDDKVDRFVEGKTLKYRLAKLLVALYRPIAKLRLKYDITSFLFEYKIHKFIIDRFHHKKKN